jgi:glycosyltransferase involved in cell wall biosynthesis
VLVFPSLTDTFGLTMIEASARGVPVAAFPAPGPLDDIEPDVTGVLHADLAVAIRSALRLDRRVCAERAATSQFLAGLAPIPASLRATLAVSRSSVIIARMSTRLTARRLTE